MIVDTTVELDGKEANVKVRHVEPAVYDGESLKVNAFTIEAKGVDFETGATLTIRLKRRAGPQ